MCIILVGENSEVSFNDVRLERQFIPLGQSANFYRMIEAEEAMSGKTLGTQNCTSTVRLTGEITFEPSLTENDIVCGSVARHFQFECYCQVQVQGQAYKNTILPRVANPPRLPYCDRSQDRMWGQYVPTNVATWRECKEHCLKPDYNNWVKVGDASNPFLEYNEGLFLFEHGCFFYVSPRVSGKVASVGSFVLDLASLSAGLPCLSFVSRFAHGKNS